MTRLLLASRTSRGAATERPAKKWWVMSGVERH